MSTLQPDLTEQRWSSLLGGYGEPYDPRDALRRLEQGDDAGGVWDDLWSELHHQGDIGDASFAAVPLLVSVHERRGVADWNTYALVATIELARDKGGSPDLSHDLRPSYDAAWLRLMNIGREELRLAEDTLLVSNIIGVLALGKRQRMLARISIEFAENERANFLKQVRWL